MLVCLLSIDSTWIGIGINGNGPSGKLLRLRKLSKSSYLLLHTKFV